MRKMTLCGEDVLWNGDPAFWSGIAPIMFPICGGLKDDKYTLGGKEYTLNKHGFTRLLTFEVEQSSDRAVTLLATDTPETFLQFPWHFEFRVSFRLQGRNVFITYNIKNKSDTTMYLCEGSHEAYACPEGIEDYDVIFPQKETLSAYVLEGNLLGHQSLPIIKESNTIALYEKYFAQDALVFKDLRSRSATLRNRKTGRSVTVDFPGADYFLLWTKPGAKYICLEPWCGIPAMTDDGYAIEEKEGMQTLAAGERYSRTHTIHL